MKKMLAMLAMAFAVGAAAEDVLVKEFELNLDKDRYVYAAKDQGVKNSFKDGVFTVEVVRNVTPATNPSNIQFWTVSTTPLKAGTTYRADLTVKANKAVNIQTFIMLNRAVLFAGQSGTGPQGGRTGAGFASVHAEGGDHETVPHAVSVPRFCRPRHGIRDQRREAL